MATSTQALSDLKTGYGQLINTLGTNMTLTHIDDSTETIKAHIVSMGKEDTAIVNALGIDSIYMHCHSTPVIKKFETITTPSGREYVVDSVTPTYINDLLVGQKLVAR